MPSPVLSVTRPSGSVSREEAADLVARACPASEYRGRRVLLIVPDATRTAPVDVFFRALHAQLGAACARFDVMVALGTHPPMPEAAICARLGISAGERSGVYADVRLLNHDWQNPDTLTLLGTIPAAEIDQLSGGRFAIDVPVRVNRHLFEYDQLLIVGPVFPHEVVGFSGGNKYLFPGVSGPEVLNFFHWLGAVVTNPMIIGHKHTPVRRVVDRAAAMVTVPKLCFCLVVRGEELAGAFAGDPDAAWEEASELSRQLHITYKERPFHTILSCAPPMYDELWVGGKCMYKLEPVVADGGELIIYAPHIHEISLDPRPPHDRGRWATIAAITSSEAVGPLQGSALGDAGALHARPRHRHLSKTGWKSCRVKVTLATGIPRRNLRAQVNLGYRDPATIRPQDYANREDEGVLLVPKAGEMLFQLREPAEWARGV